jgi:hypothetical protein
MFSRRCLFRLFDLCKSDAKRIALCSAGLAMPARRFPLPWSVEDVGGSFVVNASNERPLVFIYYGDGADCRSLARLLSRDAAKRIATGIAKLPEVLRKT